MIIWLEIIGVLAIYNLLSFYLARMVQKWLLPCRSKSFKIIYYGLLILLANAFIIGTITSIDLIRAIGSYWFALFYILVFSVPLIHIVVAFLRLTKLSRRRVEKGGAIGVIIVIIAVFSYGTFNAYSPIVRTYNVNLSNQDKVKKELNIVMVADTHFGVLSNKHHAERMVKEINDLKADLVLFPGDIVDDKMDSYSKQGIEKVIAKMKSTYGVYVSLGNHDKGDTDKLIKVLQDSNMNVLYDETAVVANSITLIGRKDKTEKGRMTIAELMDGADKSKPIILLDHQPYELGIAQQEGIDLMVSGHTHRGQVAPFQLVTQRIYENDWGYLQKGDFHSVVSSGYGFWGPPIRTNSRSEIVQIHLSY
ncbi:MULTISPECIES: metallophosphoesterase [Bacillus]|uniref:metallophosphoesterase n=1 Tax=Bacillus TaxID=1386 RepID=UPI0002D50C1E|nr:MULTISPECIES: metallophosphoesterase [Bacillus]